MLGASERADGVLADLGDRIATVAHRAHGLARPRVFVLEWSDPDIIVVAPCGFGLEGAPEQASAVMDRLPRTRRAASLDPSNPLTGKTVRVEQPDAVDQLRADLTAATIADDAEPMAAYMQHRFVFLGVKTPARRAASKGLIRTSKQWSVDRAVALAHQLREQPEREFHYVAGDLLRANQQRLRADHLTDVERFITTDSWWDTVDALASPTVGTMVRNHPRVAAAMDAWIDADDMWLARVAIIHQLHFGEQTDKERLFGYALRRASDPEFFIRKAIGWALRQYATTDPDAVRSFVDDHVDVLSPLSVREATKHL